MSSLSSHGQSMSLRTFLRLSHDQFAVPSWSDIPQPKLKSLLAPSHRQTSNPMLVRYTSRLCSRHVYMNSTGHRIDDHWWPILVTTPSKLPNETSFQLEILIQEKCLLSYTTCLMYYISSKVYSCCHAGCMTHIRHASAERAFKTSDLLSTFTLASMASGSSMRIWADHVLQGLCQEGSALLSLQCLVVWELSCAPVPAFVGVSCNPSRLAVDSLHAHVSWTKLCFGYICYNWKDTEKISMALAQRSHA